MTSTEDERKEILNELRNVSLNMQQLVELKKMLHIMQELKRKVSYKPTDDAEDVSKQQLSEIEKKLDLLETIRVELQQRHDDLNNVGFSGDECPNSGARAHVFFVEPPDIPAPTVTLDHNKLQFKPTKTQCAQCQQFITTETSTSISSVTWLACIITAMLGCVAGCCLIPFCLDSFKSTTHKCPYCHTSIATVKKL